MSCHVPYVCFQVFDWFSEHSFLLLVGFHSEPCRGLYPRHGLYRFGGAGGNGDGGGPGGPGSGGPGGGPGYGYGPVPVAMTMPFGPPPGPPMPFAPPPMGGPMCGAPSFGNISMISFFWVWLRCSLHCTVFSV